MRQIKFRGWDTRFNDMHYYEDVHRWNLNMPDLEEVTLMQFTGLLDKNGKEIYEGDVIAWETDGETWGSSRRKMLTEVKFAEGAFYTHREFTENENKLPVLADWGEVIGNIYENPDLIK